MIETRCDYYGEARGGPHDGMIIRHYDTTKEYYEPSMNPFDPTKEIKRRLIGRYEHNGSFWKWIPA